MTGLLRQGVHRLGVTSERLRLRLSPSPRALDRDDARERLGDARSVLFLCHGNICRSPLAERYARSHLAAGGPSDVSVDSAGFVDAEARESPPRAVVAARAHDVDLRGHRSARVTAERVADSDVVVVMDVRNLRRVRREFPDAIPRTYLLPAFDPARLATEVPDPHGGDAELFERTFDRVVDGVAGFVTTLRAARPDRLVA